MNKHTLSVAITFLFCTPISGGIPDGIYHKGWIDFNKNGKMDLYENPKAPLEDRVQDLLSQMTLEEKTCQMATLYGSGRVLKDALPQNNWKTEVWKDGIGNIDEEHNGLGAFKSEYSFPYAKHVNAKHTIQRWFVEKTRLGIPVDFTNEGIRGLCHDRATYFPAQCGQGATWNKKLIARIGEVEAKEAVALGYTNIYSPILDIAQDPRWGRCVETYGEDPYLVGELGKQMITSLQKYNLVATPKHFAVYSIPIGGRDGKTRTDPHVAPREMRTLYIEPFRMASQEAGALGVMSSYNDYDGEPITGSYHFLTEILRQEWGFKGYVVSDSEAVEFISNKHKVADTYEDGIAQAVNAGLNIRTHFTPPADFILPLRKAVDNGKISQETLDKRVAEILRIKFRLGLFDNPYRGNGKQAEQIVHSKEHQAVSLEAARQSLVLLKNETNLLPLSKSIRSIAVIGPNANEQTQLICRYGPANAPIKTVYQGIKELLPHTEVIYKKGCDIIDPHFPESEILDFPKTAEEVQLMEEAIRAAKQAEVVVMVLGGNELTVREDRSRTSLNLPGRQEELLKAVCATGKPIILVMLDGRASSINYAAAHIPAILHAWFPGEFCGQAVAEALFGDYNPGGRLAVTFPKSVGQIPFAFPFKPGSDESSSTSVYGALYPFGHGLSYTTFTYSDLHISPSHQGVQGDIHVSCKIKNTGKIKGDEVVQLYLRDEISSVTTYTKVLRGFERISLEAGEEQTVHFRLRPQDLGLWDKNMNFRVEPGSFKVMLGASSTDIRLHGQFEITP
ncbi:glycoside hydrolase family 3 C-terminal domain-containing protein [Phocaeicola vulgatus]|jgi:beta-glucosidase|uniref:glycoside hydrolase family 3 N-terminal domain-containing protein n=1 Tax=Phocaeicola vulgatus TaxID=821 RepID=UPI0018AB358E|nr:glycoside hydrolase family 3 N-terminal domain-containing protein [Phocaeicola vulgatus]MDB0990501.1 glycoside hydrolase family 3 C-terminal domain-containing protein [Phocaeicola vulgatus]MDB1012513.1 glycoside hydrolase family 3 C-terminal domain-containing protein [Phocaeicola vulgatus]MDB1017112.1 glycoside hydrolase family 3 C-terminal domain-containing protein [Phocaeicola vulgatus]MDB1025287.1 glycoside hydrolase family 3 C-terminal domain-containing protein [Phocaeicola vulgatus]MDC